MTIIRDHIRPHVKLVTTDLDDHYLDLDPYAMWLDSSLNYERVAELALPETNYTTTWPTITSDGSLITYGLDALAKSQDGQRIVTFGGFTVLNGKSNDISDAYWSKVGSPIITGTNQYQATAQYNLLRRILSTTSTSYYTISFYARVVSGSLTGTSIYHYGSATGPKTDIVLSGTRTRYSATVLGEPADGTIQFGLASYQTSNFPVIIIDTINITETPYAMPPTVNTTTGALLVGARYSDTGQGPRLAIASMPKVRDALDGVADGAELVTNGDFSAGVSDWVTVLNSGSTFTASNNVATLTRGTGTALAWQSILANGNRYEARITVTAVSGICKVWDNSGGTLFDLGLAGPGTYTFRFTHDDASSNFLIAATTDGSSVSFTDVSVRQISPAQGEIEFTWTPNFNAGDIGGNVNLITANATAAGLIYYDDVAGTLKSTDGTNTAEIACTPVSGTTYTIKLQWGTLSGQQMRLSLNGTAGTAATHANRFPYSTYLYLGWQAVPGQEIGNIKIRKVPQW